MADMTVQQSSGPAPDSPVDVESSTENTASLANCRILPASRILSAILLCVLAFAASISLAVAVKEALSRGIDFQWSGAHLLAMGQDPWETFLDRDPQHQIILGQQPNYLHELYVLMLPLGKMDYFRSLEYWCAINLILLTAIFVMVCRYFKLNRSHSFLLIVLTLCSTPFRVVLSNGQLSIVILFLVTSYYYFDGTEIRGTSLGLSYAKYSFSPLLALTILFKRRFAILTASILPPLAGLIAAWFILRGNIATLALEPFETSRIAMGPGWGDIMTPLEILLRNMDAPPKIVYAVPTVVALGLSVIVALRLARATQLKERNEFPLILIFTLLLFKHQPYDYVVLLVPTAALMAMARSLERTLALFLLVYFWIGLTLITRFKIEVGMAVTLCNVSFLLAFAICFTKALGRIRTNSKG